MHVAQTTFGVTAYVDTAWARFTATRKSTTGCMITVARVAVYRYSRTQTTVALSSSEPEPQALSSGTTETMGVLQFLRVRRQGGWLCEHGWGLRCSEAHSFATRSGSRYETHPTALPLPSKTWWLQVSSGHARLIRTKNHLAGLHNSARCRDKRQHDKRSATSPKSSKLGSCYRRASRPTTWTNKVTRRLPWPPAEATT